MVLSTKERENVGVWIIIVLQICVLIYHHQFLLGFQVHQNLPVYAVGIQEFQNRLERLQIEQAKLAETLTHDKRYCGRAGVQGGQWVISCWIFASFPPTAVRGWRSCFRRSQRSISNTEKTDWLEVWKRSSLYNMFWLAQFLF